MSRQIDITKPLSDEDLEYLDSRARHDLIAQNARLMAETAQDPGPEIIDDGNTGDVDPFKRDDGTDLLAGTHPGEIPFNDVQRLEAQGISDLGDEDKNPDHVVREVSEPTRQAGDAEDASDADAQTTGADEDGDNYDDESVWSYRDLQEEAKSREGVKASGSREEIIAALREDDAAE